MFLFMMGKYVCPDESVGSAVGNMASSPVSQRESTYHLENSHQFKASIYPNQRTTSQQ